MLETVSELPDILGGVRKENTISMQKTVLPLSYILYSVQVLLLHRLQVHKFSVVLLWDGSELIVKQCEMLVEGKIQLFQSLLLYILFAILLLRPHCQSLFTGEVSPDDSGMQKLLIDNR